MVVTPTSGRRRTIRGDLTATFRIVTFNLRGHGLSEKPPEAEYYADGQLWADDVASVIDQTGLEKPILVAWSYGGYVVADYLRAHGDSRIGGINLVGAGVLLMPPAFDHIGPGMLENVQGMCARDLAANIAATRRFLHACTSRPLGDDEVAAALGWNMVVPSAVRGALLSREVDSRDILASVSVRSRDPRAGRHDRVAFDGRAHAHRLPGRDRVVVRRCRSHTVLAAAGSLRPRTRHPGTQRGLHSRHGPVTIRHRYRAVGRASHPRFHPPRPTPNIASTRPVSRAQIGDPDLAEVLNDRGVGFVGGVDLPRRTRCHNYRLLRPDLLGGWSCTRRPATPHSRWGTVRSWSEPPLRW